MQMSFSVLGFSLGGKKNSGILLPVLALFNIFKSSISTKNNLAASRVQSTQVLTKVREANGICK